MLRIIRTLKFKPQLFSLNITQARPFLFKPSYSFSNQNTNKSTSHSYSSKDNSQEFTMLMSKALSKFETGNFSEFISEVDNILEGLDLQKDQNSEKSSELYLYKSMAYWRMGDIVKSIESLKQAETVSSGFANISPLLRCKIALSYGQIFLASRELASSLKYLKDAITIFQSNKLTDAGTLATIYICLGQISQLNKNYDEALQAYRTCLDEIKENNLSKANLVNCYEGLASAYAGKKDFTKAQEFYNKVISMLGEGDRQAVNSLKGLATIFLMQDNIEEAEKYYKKALNLNIKFYGENDIGTASILDSLGTCYSLKEQYDEALQSHNRALSILRELPNTKTDQIVVLNNIAKVYIDQQLWEQAKPYLQQSLQLSLECYGEPHESLTSIYLNLGNVYEEGNDYSQALSYYHKAEANNSQLYGKTHYENLQVQISLGMVYHRSGDLSCARDCYKKAEEIVKANNIPSTSAELLGLYNEYSGLNYDEGKHEEALIYCNKSIDIAKTLNDKTLLNNLLLFKAEIESCLRKDSEAIQSLIQAVKLAVESKSELVFLAPHIYKKIGSLYERNQQDKEAVIAYQHAAEMLLKFEEEDEKKLIDIYCKIAQLHKKLGNDEEAKKYMEKVAEFKTTGKDPCF